MISVFVDRRSNMAAIDLQPGRAIDRSEEVGTSLLANYDSAGELVGVEILSLAAVRRPEVVAELHALLRSLGELDDGTSFVAGPFLTLAPRRIDIVDLLVQQINQAITEDGSAQEARVLA